MKPTKPMTKLCVRCQREPHEDWPTDNGYLCQECWESECSKSWWHFVEGWAKLKDLVGEFDA